MDKKRYFPLYIDLKNKNILIVGGGQIAYRRVAKLKEYDTNIIIVSPVLCEELKHILGANINWIKDSYKKEYVKGIDIVFDITDDNAVHEALYHICKENNILFNCAHKKEACDFYFPATADFEEITVAIAGDGSNHIKVKKLAADIRKFLKG